MPEIGLPIDLNLSLNYSLHLLLAAMKEQINKGFRYAIAA